MSVTFHVVNVVVMVVAILVAAKLIPGIRVTGVVSAVVIAIALGLSVPAIGPFLAFLTIPVNVVTVAGAALLVNALVVLIMAAMVPGFQVDNFIAALLFCMVVSSIAHVITAFAAVQ